MASADSVVRVVRWRGPQHPSLSTINKLMHQEDLRPYLWSPAPNQRQPVRSNGYHRVLFVVDGAVEVTLPDSNQRITLRSGDRLDVPAGVRHGINVGASGAKCVEAALRRTRVNA